MCTTRVFLQGQADLGLKLVTCFGGGALEGGLEGGWDFFGYLDTFKSLLRLFIPNCLTIFMCLDMDNNHISCRNILDSLSVYF